MIPFDFEYYRPATISEAVELFQYLANHRKNPMYYGGGTEIITWARMNDIHPGAVIDLKSIPECHVMEIGENVLVIGSCVTLSALSRANSFPLLSKSASGAADQTARNKITLGGNICGRIHFREAVLPFLLADSWMLIAGPQGIKEVPIHEVFNQQMRLEQGEFIVQVITDSEYLSLPFVHFKRRQIGNVGYPLVTLAALKKDNRIRTAYSGVCAFPFRSIEMEQVLNDNALTLTERVEQAIGKLPAPVLTDTEGSAGYREFVLKQTMLEAMAILEGR